MKKLLITTAKKESKQTATSDTPLVLSANIDLGPTEKKGPFLLALSQPLKYIIDEIGQPALMSEKPVSGEELAALINTIDQKAQISIIFGAGINVHRYAAVKHIRSSDIKPAETSETIFANAHTQALQDEQKWIDSIKEYLPQWKEKQGFKLYIISELMKEQLCVNLINTISQEYKSGKSKKLTDSINVYAEGAVDILYPDLLRAAKSGSKFYSPVDHSILPQTEIRQKLVNASISCAIQEFALLAYLAKENQSKFILYKGSLKKHSNKKHGNKNQVNIKSFFSQHAPKLINLILKEFIEKTTEKQCKIRYKEYFMEQRSLTQPFLGPELLMLFHVIAALPQYLTDEGFPEIALAWYLAVRCLEEKLSKALMKASSEKTIKELSHVSEEKTMREKEIPIDLLSDFDCLVTWMGKFTALVSIYPSAGLAFAKINTLVFSNVSSVISFKIYQTTLNSLTKIKSYQSDMSSNFKNGSRFDFESHSTNKTIAPILDGDIMSRIFSSS